MRRALNAFALLLALALSWLLTSRSSVAPGTHRSAREGSVQTTGHTPTRIASASTISDHVLAEIAVPSRVRAISAVAAGPALWRFEDAERIQRLTDLEAILLLEPDVLFTAALRTDRSVARLREAGVNVVDLGEVRTFDQLPACIARIGDAIGEPARARAYADSLAQRMERLRALGATQPGLYLGVHGTHLYGGTRGSSYGDVLAAGGVQDLAARNYEGWPEYSMEDLLRMNPPLFVMPQGDSEKLCALPQGEHLRACQENGFIELEGDLLSDPGPRMVDAAEQLRALLTHGR